MGTVLHVCVYDWCVWRVTVLAVCVHRKRGAPQGSVFGLAQAPGGEQREGGSLQVWKNNSQRHANSQKQYSHKEILATFQC